MYAFISRSLSSVAPHLTLKAIVRLRLFPDRVEEQDPATISNPVVPSIWLKESVEFVYLNEARTVEPWVRLTKT